MYHIVKVTKVKNVQLIFFNTYRKYYCETWIKQNEILKNNLNQTNNNLNQTNNNLNQTNNNNNEILFEIEQNMKNHDISIKQILKQNQEQDILIKKITYKIDNMHFLRLFK